VVEVAEGESALVGSVPVVCRLVRAKVARIARVVRAVMVIPTLVVRLRGPGRVFVCAGVVVGCFRAGGVGVGAVGVATGRAELGMSVAKVGVVGETSTGSTVTVRRRCMGSAGVPG
jgi:hypothetical protein